MPAPCSLCLEDLAEDDLNKRFLRCVALPGRQPGLRLLTDGSAGWMIEQGVACELIVSVDQQLLLYRPSNAPRVVVERAGRSLLAPAEKPVVLLDGDEVRVAGRRLRVHVHGETSTVAPPTPLLARLIATGRSAASAVAIGAAMVSCDSSPAGEVSAAPSTHPATAVSETLAPAMSVASAPAGSTTAVSSSSASAPASSSAPPRRPPKAKPPKTPKPPPIEVRDFPPYVE